MFYRFVPPYVTPLMVIRVGEQLLKKKTVKLQKKWVSLEDISSNMQLAVITAEDQKFPNHFGFDFDAIQKAWKHNQKKPGKVVKGGSTISQQVAKNVFLWPHRSWFRKGLEAYFTFLIEVFWPKERIIEVYLNVIETGDGLYGIEVISNSCFRRSAKDLSREQSALIAATIPNPRLWSPCKPTPYIHRKKAWILRNMESIGTVTFHKKNKVKK